MLSGSGGQVEGVNRTIKGALMKGSHGHGQRRTQLSDSSCIGAKGPWAFGHFVLTYASARALKPLKGAQAPGMHPQKLDFGAGPLHPEQGPPDAATKHLG